MRLTLNDVWAPVAAVLIMNSTSTKALGYINRAQELLLNEGRWVGTTIKYRVCSEFGYITWPREIQTIEAMRVGGVPTPLQNQWYQFLDYGGPWDESYLGRSWGTGYNGYGAFTGVDERESISFFDVCAGGNPKQLKVYGTAVEAADAQILLQYYDNQGNYVRTNDPVAGWVDGVYIPINPTTPQTTITPCSAWVGVQKPLTNGVVRVTELDTVTGLERLLAVYEPSETNPSYRRTYLPGFCYENQPPLHPRSVEVIGSARFIPAIKPTDYLCISSLNALIDASKGIYLRDNNQPQAGDAFYQTAMTALDRQLAKWTGSGTIQTPSINIQNRCELGVSNFV